jgi:hypothetical protein
MMGEAERQREEGRRGSATEQVVVGNTKNDVRASEEGGREDKRGNTTRAAHTPSGEADGAHPKRRR